MVDIGTGRVTLVDAFVDGLLAAAALVMVVVALMVGVVVMVVVDTVVFVLEGMVVALGLDGGHGFADAFSCTTDKGSDNG